LPPLEEPGVLQQSSRLPLAQVIGAQVGNIQKASVLNKINDICECMSFFPVTSKIWAGTLFGVTSCTGMVDVLVL
jgi:hypothetical protein